MYLKSWKERLIVSTCNNLEIISVISMIPSFVIVSLLLVMEWNINYYLLIWYAYLSDANERLIELRFGNFEIISAISIAPLSVMLSLMMK